MEHLIERAAAEGRSLLEHEAMALLAEAGIPTRRHVLVQDEAEAVAAAGQIGWPVILKVVSKDILHKSDVGGVRLGIRSPEELSAAWHAMTERLATACPEAELAGRLVMEELPQGTECIVGMVRDAQFGPAMMFGLGGIFVELLQDVSFALLPVDHAEALEMIRETKGARLLQGYRGDAVKDIDALADLIVRLGGMVERYPQIRELDLNPVFVYESGVMPADARILL